MNRLNYDILQKQAKDLADLLQQKNESYGQSVEKAADILKILYPNGITVDQYGDLHFIVRILDKLTRITGGNKWSFGESPWKDCAGYSLLRQVQEIEEGEQTKGDSADNVHYSTGRAVLHP